MALFCAKRSRPLANNAWLAAEAREPWRSPQAQQLANAPTRAMANRDLARSGGAAKKCRAPTAARGGARAIMATVDHCPLRIMLSDSTFPVFLRGSESPRETSQNVPPPPRPQIGSVTVTMVTWVTPLCSNDLRRQFLTHQRHLIGHGQGSGRFRRVTGRATRTIGAAGSITPFPLLAKYCRHADEQIEQADRRMAPIATGHEFCHVVPKRLSK
jgi:hypothetical protein